jgi:DNA-binding beta-propeller fold protein YncE
LTGFRLSLALAPAIGASICSGPPPVSAAEGVRLVAVPELALTIGSDGSDFRAPGGVSLDPFGNVFVADTGNHRVVHFDPEGRFVFEFGGYGWGDGEFSGPTDVCAREGFRLFVVDEGNERIQEFDIGDSSPEGTVFPFREGAGIGGEKLVRPVRMDADDEGRIYVSDSLGHFVWIFAPTGELVGRLGALGEEPGRFRYPAGVAVAGKGRVHVADAGNGRIQVFDAIGNWIAAWSGPAEDPLVEPTGIDVGADGTVWVADAGASRIRAFTATGVPLFSFGGGGDGPGRFVSPVDVAVAPNGRIWVVDSSREVVERYRIERVAGDE